MRSRTWQYAGPLSLIPLAAFLPYFCSIFLINYLQGAMNSYRRWNNFVTPLYMMPHPIVRLSFAPLAHTTERQLTWLTLTFGGRQLFSTGVCPLRKFSYRLRMFSFFFVGPDRSYIGQHICVFHQRFTSFLGYGGAFPRVCACGGHHAERPSALVWFHLLAV